MPKISQQDNTHRFNRKVKFALSITLKSAPKIETVLKKQISLVAVAYFEIQILHPKEITQRKGSSL